MFVYTHPGLLPSSLALSCVGHWQAIVAVWPSQQSVSVYCTLSAYAHSCPVRIHLFGVCVNIFSLSLDLSIARSSNMAEANQILHKTGEKLGETLEQVCRTTKLASDKVQSCFDARLGSLIVGIIMSVISGLAVLTCIGGFFYVNVITSLGYELDGRPTSTDMDAPEHRYALRVRLDDVINVLIVNACVTFGLIFSLLEFSFSVVLADGASKRKVDHLKAYFIYGNVKSAILFIVSMVLFILLWDKVPGYLTLLICGINIMMSVLAYAAYMNIKKSAKGYAKFDNEAAVEA